MSRFILCNLFYYYYFSIIDYLLFNGAFRIGYGLVIFSDYVSIILPISGDEKIDPKEIGVKKKRKKAESKNVSKNVLPRLHLVCY